MENFNLKRLKEIKGNKKYWGTITNTFIILEKLVDVDTVI
jgi:hypothetical protein